LDIDGSGSHRREPGQLGRSFESMNSPPLTEFLGVLMLDKAEDAHVGAVAVEGMAARAE
jgi:hypothetical protein